MPQDEPTFHHRGAYEGHYGRLSVTFAARELPALSQERDRPVHLTTVEVNNGLDFDALGDYFAACDANEEMSHDERQEAKNAPIAVILDAVMVGDGDTDNPDAGGFAYSWADDGSWIEIDYTPLTIRLMPKGVVRTSASG
jgi:hypothetical protein